jgi:hypothetical protein
MAPSRELPVGVGEDTRDTHCGPPTMFFKALKQNLKVKSFVGTSENALRIQIWTALIAILLLKWLHHLSKAKWPLSNLASMLRLNLFTYRDLRNWLDDPFETPPLLPEAAQLTLAFAWLRQASGRPRSENPDSQPPKSSVSIADFTTLSCFGQQCPDYRRPDSGPY